MARIGRKETPPPLPPEIVRIIEALAIAAARRDHERELKERKK